MYSTNTPLEEALRYDLRNAYERWHTPNASISSDMLHTLAWLAFRSRIGDLEAIGGRIIDELEDCGGERVGSCSPEDWDRYAAQGAAAAAALFDKFDW